tara:strand:+ start:1485 stop:1808 length:324 start_codon:yes stop_codon:yes gene_type:complete
MPNFAKIKDNVVTQIIVAEKEFFDTFIDSSPGEWINVVDDLGKRKNKAIIGCTYDKNKNAFIDPKPFDSWTLNEDTCKWEAPVIEPVDGLHSWNESIKKWEKKEEGE